MADLIDHMTSRFLQWKLPDDFSPDGGVTFTAVSPHGPVGTNLLTYAQAKAMVEYMIDGAPIAALPAQGVRVRQLEWNIEPRNGWKQGVAWADAYHLIRKDDGWHYANHNGGVFPTIDAAKAAAQADYERRILAALAPAEAGGVEAHPYSLRPDLQRIVNNAKTAPQWDTERDRLAPAPVDALVKAAEPTLDEALAVVCAAMTEGEKWGVAVNAAMPILNADIDQSGWNTVSEVRNAINAALAALRRDKP